jgi:hypothetical protein
MPCVSRCLTVAADAVPFQMTENTMLKIAMLERPMADRQSARPARAPTPPVATSATPNVMVTLTEPPTGYRLRRRQAADYLGVSAGFLEKLACRGSGPCYLRVSSRLVLYERDELDRWAAAHRVQGTPETGVNLAD